MNRIAPSARIEEQIEVLLADGIGDPDGLTQVGRLGAQLILQRALEDEVAAFLQRARYERSPNATGSRNGVRPRRVQTAEGEFSVAMPQVRGVVERFVSQVIPDARKVVRTHPLEALIIGAYVRGLSDRDIESLLDEAGLGHVSRNRVSEICQQLRDRYRRSVQRAWPTSSCWCCSWTPSTCPPVLPEPRKACWWPGATPPTASGYSWVRLGQRESHADWLDLGRNLAKRGLRAPWLAVSDGAPGLIKAIDELWPEADRQRCTVHRLRNVLAKLPKKPELHERVRRAYWSALDEAADPAGAEQRLRSLVGELERDYPSAAACLAEDLPALCVHLRYLPRLGNGYARRTCWNAR